ncbi:MAG: helix-turn-helix domain-containing protein [Clostridia bacterium]|nr:helix-turn-helix domain-containing protein [Clostridia bacterium]
MFLFKYDDNTIFLSQKRDENLTSELYPMHAHQFCELLYILEGDFKYTVEGHTYDLHPGSLLLMRDSEAHTPHLKSVQAYERIVIQFPFDFLETQETDIYDLIYAHPLGQGNLFLGDKEQARFLHSLITKVMVKEKTEGLQRERTRALLLIILRELIQIRKSFPTSDKGPNTDLTLEENLIRYINENLTTIKSLEAIEKEFFFSVSYLNRIFKKATGSSIWTYIIQKRLLMARGMLRSGTPAALVSSNCGFEDYSSFYRQYKKRFGISPTKERTKG